MKKAGVYTHLATDHYHYFEDGGATYVIAASRVDAYERELESATRTRTVTGTDLVGHHYRPLFPYFADAENAFVVLAGSQQAI